MICQYLVAFWFFLLRALGEGCDSLGTKRQATGILQSIPGFFSLLVCLSQILNNETFVRQVFPTFLLSEYNDIDLFPPLDTVPVAQALASDEPVPVV